MKFVLFCEGLTEMGALPEFLRRWLDTKLPERVGVKPVRFNGWAEMVKDAPTKARLHLAQPDIIGVIGLLDIYGLRMIPSPFANAPVDRRCAWAKQEIEAKVGQAGFRQHFAVHELEAWILSAPDILPSAVRKKLPPRAAGEPETVNFDDPPASLLDRLYEEATGRGYKKVVHGSELFRQLDPDVVYLKCPSFKRLADDMLSPARARLDRRT